MKNSKKKNNTFKRVAAGALSMALVAGAMPANVGGFLTGGSGIVAYADSYDLTVNTGQDTNENEYGTVTKSQVGGEYHFNATPKTGYRFVNFTFEYVGNQLTFSTIRVNRLDGLRNVVAHFAVYSAPTVNAATELTYNGTAQALVTAPAGAAIQYRYKKSTDETYSDWSATAPSATDAGTYNVQWYSTDNANYAASGSSEEPNSVNVTISPVALTNDNTAVGWVDMYNNFTSSTAYTGSDITPNVYYKYTVDTLAEPNVTMYRQLTQGTDYSLVSGSGITASASGAGEYSININGGGNYSGGAIKSWSITKANLTANDYTAPVGGTVSYTGNAVALLTDDNKGSVATYTGTETAKGTMKYAATRYRAVSATNLQISSVDDVNVGDIYSPISGEVGISFPKGCTVTIGDTTYDDSNAYYSDEGVTICQYPQQNGGGYFIYSGDTLNGSGIKITAVDKETKAITAEVVDYDTAFNALVNALNWSTDVPQGTDLGNWYVWYKVEGDANHNDTKPAYVTSAIDYATTSLTLSPSLTGAVIVENGAAEALAATDGVYTLAGTKKYNIYTNKSIADSTAATALDLTSKSSNKTFGGNTYSYRYEIEVPTTPAEGGYILSHTNNYVGKVSTEVGKANVMNIQEDGVTTENVAVLNADGVIYYGDKLEKDELVTIADGYGSIVNVDEIYLENNTASGGKVTGDALVIGTTYLLTAKVSVDADGDPDNGISGNTIYLKQQVTYAARPMTMNEYALKTEDGLVPLTLSGSTVTVPENYWVCIPNEGSSNPYIRVEEPDEAINALFTCTKKSTFVYNSAAQKPVIVVKNGGDNTIVLSDTAVAANETATPPVAAVAKDYNNAVAEKTDAGSYSYALTAEANGKYSDSVTVAWSIAQADVSQYITVAPKNNVDTDGNKETLEAVVYDGAVLDGTDFEVKTNEAYAALAADSPVKKLVDEFIDQLKAKAAVAADPANNIEAQPAVPVKTFVNVSGGRYGVTTDITYENETPSSGVSINANSVGSYSNVILKGNLTFQSTGGDITNAKITCGEYEKLKSNNVELTLDGNSIMCGDDTILTKNDNEWFKIESITHQIGNETNEYTINLTKVPKTETRYETYDIKNAGAHKANVTVSNSNFKTVEFKQKLDNNGKPVEGEDNSVAVTIAKRDVTLTPDEDQAMTYRDTEMPDLTYTIEDAKADGLTGVVAADKALFQKTTGEGSDAVTTNTGAIYVDKLVQEDAQATPVQFVYATDENDDIDYTTAGLNNAGEYTYKAFDFDNYNVVFPEEDSPTFTVDPLNLKNIENLNIVLNGVTTGWTQNGSSGSYIYDGSTKQVEVSEVFKPNEDVTETIDTIVNNDQKTAKQFTTEDESQISFDITYPIDENSHYIFVGKYDETYKGYSLKITPPTGKAVKTIKFYTPNNEQPGTIYVNGEANAMVDFKTVYEAAGGNLETTGLKISKLEITYSSTDYTLNADTDYTVGGATKRASAGTHNVQVMGKGNYTGVTTAPWDITEAEAGESTLLIDNTPSNEYNGKSYDGKAVTANVSFGDGASAYYVADAETDIKYYENNNVLESAPVDAGTYKVVATITCDGYATKTIEKTFNISPAVITVDSNAKTKAITYGDKLPAVTQADIDAIVGLTDDDKAYFQKFFTDGKLGLGYAKKYNANAQLVDDTSKLTFTLNGTLTQEEVGIIQQFINNYNTSNFYWNVITNAKSIKDSSIKVEFTEGDTAIINPDGTFASDSAIKVYDTAILDQDGKATELVELGENNAATADYELTVESTATEGVYTLEIVGKNNYRGVRKIEFKAITAAKAATTFDIDFVETYVSNNKNRIRFNAAASVKSGYTVKETGVLYFNAATGAPQAELTMENIGGDIKKARNLSDSYLVGLLDNGNGVYARFYSIVNDGTNDYVVYATDEAEYYNYAELSAKTATTFDIDLVETYVSNNKNRIRFNAAASVKSGYTVKEVGVLYFNAATGAPQAELTMENIGGDIKKARNLSDSYLVGLLDNGNGVYARFYTIVNDGTNDYVVYATDEAEYYNYNQLNAEKATTLDVAFVETYVSNNKNRIRLNATASVEGSYTVKEVGVLYFNAATGTPQAELTMENIGGDIKKARNLSDSYLVGLLDNGNSVYARFYTIVNDGTNDYVVYATDKAVIYNYAELSASLS